MGQAKARGTFAVRLAEGTARLEAEALQRKLAAAALDAERIARQEAAALERKQAAAERKATGRPERHNAFGRSRMLLTTAIALSAGLSHR